MANLKENNFHNLRMNINKDEYYDFLFIKIRMVHIDSIIKLQVTELYHI